MFTTELPLDIEQPNADALLLARGVMGSNIVQFVISFLKPDDASNWKRSSGVPSS